MIQSLQVADVEWFRRAVARRLGLHFDNGKLDFLADVLGSRLAANGQSPAAYLACLDTTGLDDEIGPLAEALTVPETYFFRHYDQYRALSEIALPDRIAIQAGTKRLRILSAGCASGEEPYSLAILAREAVDPSWDVAILGIDVNEAMVKKATQAVYTAWALRETPTHVQHRWFRPEGREFVLVDEARQAVRFAWSNLAADDLELWQPDSYDIVFFRNVLMYFTPETAAAAIARIARALKPGGYLFLGHAETLRGLSSDFHLQHTHETFYYQRKDRIESPLRSPAPRNHSRVPLPAAAAVGCTGTWIDTIRHATDRVAALTGPSGFDSSSLPSDQAAPSELELALELLRAERFGDALETMQLLPPESGRDRDVLLLTAALHTHRGRLAEAESACRCLLAVDEMSAGAHYLLALCREDAQDRTGAVYHDRLAIYLDPSFAMPHLHLGLLARRAGDRATGQRELGQALLLLQREDVSRLLLFGGGFGRETLAALCRTELAVCGGPT